MNSIKKMLLFGVLVVGAVQARISIEQFDKKLLNPYILATEEAFDSVDASMEVARTAYVSGKEYLKDVYERKKEHAQRIYRELRDAYKASKANGDASWYLEKQTYEAYKQSVYNYWRKHKELPDLF